MHTTTADPNRLALIARALATPPPERGEEHVAQLAALLPAVPLFAKLLRAGAGRELARALTLRRVAAGEPVFRYGDNPDAFYVALSGALAVLAPTADGALRPVARVAPGQSFGELALVANRPRAATVAAAEDCELAVCDRKTYLDHVRDAEKRRVDKKLDFLRRHVWPGADEALALKYVCFFEEAAPPRGARLFAEGGALERLFLVVKGRAKVG